MAPQITKPEKPASAVRPEKAALPEVPKPDRDCCQSGCYGCAWADAMRARGEL